ncbi:hypothetical protein LEP1GSC082_1014 [Leptospira kirschneri str. H2]|uniref:Uncharacterized protein n=2 Tax=Leptospira kirschneri TaxID=29507 RepID=A0A0E2B8M9_9LEPT|nr:hypothetical protein LEP1GSC081_0741 [Leptospira kirschneri str. H1]EKO60385.1 hypothetical protein LEP1GSC082_1014 [Leptospira kirschneri str. H2]EMK23986.1 hypothetical protein LEP1GSC008_3328 [Leptospira kirschneri serovar Bulgarica str. Nikolaevo]
MYISWVIIQKNLNEIMTLYDFLREDLYSELVPKSQKILHDHSLEIFNKM